MPHYLSTPGYGRSIQLGTSGTYIATFTGQLRFYFNDDVYPDNSGSYTLIFDGETFEVPGTEDGIAGPEVEDGESYSYSASGIVNAFNGQSTADFDADGYNPEHSGGFLGEADGGYVAPGQMRYSLVGKYLLAPEPPVITSADYLPGSDEIQVVIAAQNDVLQFDLYENDVLITSRSNLGLPIEGSTLISFFFPATGTYVYKAKAINDIATSDFSDPVELSLTSVTEGLPAKPKVIFYYSKPQDKLVIATLRDDNVTSYNVTLTSPTAVDYNILVPTSILSLDFDHPAPRGTWTCIVQANNANGSTSSDPKTAFVDITLQTPVLTHVGKTSEGKITAQCTSVTGTTGYRWYRKDELNGGYVHLGDTVGTILNNSDLEVQKDVKYTITCRAMGDGPVYSAWSNELVYVNHTFGPDQLFDASDPQISLETAIVMSFAASAFGGRFKPSPRGQTVPLPPLSQTQQLSKPPTIVTPLNPGVNLNLPVPTPSGFVVKPLGLPPHTVAPVITVPGP